MYGLKTQLLSQKPLQGLHIFWKFFGLFGFDFGFGFLTELAFEKNS